LSTVFGKIIAGELPSEVVYENDRIIAIKDIAPVAPVHILIMPKKEIPDLQSMTKEDTALMAEIVSIAQELAKKYNITEGYRLLTNNGRGAGQTVFHLHFHLIGGRPLHHLA
jgi:histidine triad (HIT) family protein